ncbi:MAG: hypothetical protein QF473_03455 [Planctomycetota bacterium]|nr:hypothetical protein [Planctomycetota bacterium]
MSTFFPILLSSLFILVADAERIPIKNVQDAVRQLKLDLPEGRTRALDWLNRKQNKVVDANLHPNDVLRPYLKSETKKYALIARAFMRWARSKDADALIGMNNIEVGSQKIFGFTAIGTLFRVNPERGREYFEEQIKGKVKGFQNRAIMGIADMGGTAEGLVMPLLKSKTPKVVESTARILAKIGTHRCIPALDQAAAATTSRGLKKHIEKAKSKIKARK